MAHIPPMPMTAENAEASQMIHVVNRLIMAINRVIADLPEPKEERPVGATGATGATGAAGAAVHPAPHHVGAHR